MIAVQIALTVALIGGGLPLVGLFCGVVWPWLFDRTVWTMDEMPWWKDFLALWVFLGGFTVAVLSALIPTLAIVVGVINVWLHL